MSDWYKQSLSRLRSNDPTFTEATFYAFAEGTWDKAKVRNLADALRSKDLADALRSNTHLKRLHFLWCEVGDGGAKAIANALRVNRSVKRLHLVECRSGDGDAKAIAAALSDNSTLTELSLLGNCISADGAKAIAAALSERNESGGRRHTPLAYLDLRYNDIGDDGGRAMAAMLRSNTTIGELNLGGCRIGDDTANALAAALVTNDTIETLGLSRNRIGDVGAKALAAANLLRLRCCDIYVNNNRSIGEEGRSVFDQSLGLCQNEDIDASDVPKAVVLIEQLLPATNFISIPPHKLSAIVATRAAVLCAANPPKPGRLAILNTAQGIIIDQILSQTCPIPEAAMPLALRKIGEGSAFGRNAVSNRNAIDALFIVCRDKPHLFKDANKDEGMHEQGKAQGILQGISSENSPHVPVEVTKTKRGLRRYMQNAIAAVFKQNRSESKMFHF